MIWRKKTIIQHEGTIYNLENWITISIVKGTIESDPSDEKTNVLKICFAENDTHKESSSLYANYSYCKTHNMDKLLGLDAGTIDSLFLAAECRDP